MVLADSHTISKSIYNDNKVDNNIFESIHDVDRPTNHKTKRDRQHKYKLYKEENVAPPDSLKETKPYGLDKGTDKITLKAIKLTTEHAKLHKTPKRKIGFWKKLRGKDKKKETNKHDPNDRKRRISNNKKEHKKMYHLATKDSRNPGPKTKGRRKNRKKFSPRQPELKVSKRDAGTLFSTRPYSSTPQSYKLQTGIAPQIDNMLKSKYRMQNDPPFTAVVEAHSKEVYNISGQIESMTSKISLLKERYGIYGKKPAVKPEFSLENNAEASSKAPLTSKTQEIVTVPDLDFQLTGQIEALLNSMKVRAMQMAAYEKPLVTDLIKSSVTEATYNYDSHEYGRLNKPGIPTPRNSLSTYVSINDIQTVEKRTPETTKSDEFNLNDSIFSANTESHYIAARSIREDTMTIAQNVEDLLQRELKNLYNKVKHKVSNDLRKEVHTVKSTAKESYSKITGKLSSKFKAAANASSTMTSTSTKPTKPKTLIKTCACTTTTQTKKLKSLVTTTTTLRVKKKDDKDDDKVIIADNFTPEVLYAKTYDDYMMLTLYEQMLAKTHDDNMRKMLATSEYPMFPKIKREAVRLSKRNPETLTDVKLKEVIQSIYDDGSNIPDYDYIDPAANVTSTGRTTAVIYNELDYNEVIDPSDSSDNSAQDPLGESMEVKNKVKGAAPAEVDTTTEAHSSAVDSDNAESTASDTSYEGLSNKISYNEFVNGYKHYLKFQKDQGCQNFSNLVKYQAHRHHSVDDIGKYILSKIPPLPTYNKKKRDVRFSDDSDNNMDYQEITTRSDDSWFKKHFYLFIDNGPPKKYHTSETVELKPTEPKLYITEPTSRVGQTEQLFVKVDPNGVPRKAKDAQGPASLDDLSRVLDSIKKQQTISQLSGVNLKTEKDIPLIDNMNATADTTQVKSFIGKLFASKRRNAAKKDPITMLFFPTTPNYMFAESMKGRLRRSAMKENFESTIMADFINKDIEDKASTGTKELYVDTSQLGNKETNKYGYVDIDLVPSQTAVVKLRDVKKSRFKNFFKKFHFRKKNKKDNKPKRSCYYNSQNRRRERFNPIKRLKAMFSVKEAKDKEVITEKFPDYDIANTQIESFKPVKFDKPMSLDEMQKLVPNISDTYFEPPPPERSTTKEASQIFGLDSKDEDFLSNIQPSSPSSIKHSAATRKKTGPPVFSFSNATIVPTLALSSKSPIATITSKPEILRVPSCNVMTVNVKTMGPLPSTTFMTTEPTSVLTIDDMSLILDNMQDKIQKNQEEFPKLNTIYTPSRVSQTKYNYKKNIGKPRFHSKNFGKLPLDSKDSSEELVIKSKLTRIAKFPIKKRRYRIKTHDDSEPVIIGQDYSNIDGPSVLEYIHDFGNRNAPYERKKQAKGNSLKKLHHPHQPKPYNKNKDRYTDYFNDLLMWHNDILNLDTVPNPQWAKILRTLQSDTGNSYTTPNMNKLMIELNEINDVMDPGRRLNNTIHIFPNGSLKEGPKDRVGVRALPNESNEPGAIKSLAMQDNTLVTSNDIMIRGEAKYYQYNKPQLQEIKVGPSDLITKLNRINIDTEESIVPFKWKGGRRSYPSTFENYPEPAIIVDTTLMAYDDDVESVTRALEPKKKFKNSQKAKLRNKMDTNLKQTKNMTSAYAARYSQRSDKAVPINKMDHPSLLKTNSAPMQYYTTPLPMKSKDFNKFLKENNMDVDFVTSPILDLPTIKEWRPNKNYKQSKISTSTNIPIQAVHEAPIAKQGKPAMKEAIPTMQEAALPMQEAAPAMQEATPAMQIPAPAMQIPAPSMQIPAPSMQIPVPPMQGAAPPMQGAAPPMLGIAPPAMQGAAPPMQRIASPMQGTMQEAALDMQEAAPAIQDASVQGAVPAATKNADASGTTKPTTRPSIAGFTKPAHKKQSKTTEKPGLSKQIKSKVESITKAIGKSVKFSCDHPKEKLKENKPSNLSTSKSAFWDDDFDRYKRYSEIKLPRNTVEPSKATQEANYYSIFKKKMKEKLFEKKATPTAPVERPAPNPYTDPQNKEVEITIINFDDIEKMTSQLPFETFTLPAAKKEDIGTYTDFGDLSNIIKTKSKTKVTLKSLDLTPKEEIHNELLYKDVFNEHNSITSVAPTKEYIKDLTKTTEYVNPIASGEQTSAGDTFRYPFEKMPMYPNILSKVPQHLKKFNSIPKRVHISSHHYKYDIFYDDLKSTAKPTEVEGFQPKLIKITTNDLRPTKQSPSPKRTPASEKEAKANKQVVKNINGTASRYRYRRRVWGSEAPHKKRKHFTFRGCKPKSTGGLTEPTGYFEAVTIPSALDADPGVTGTNLKEAISNAMKNTAKVFKTWQTDTVASTDDTAQLSKRTDPVTLAKDNTESSWPWKSEPMSDIEDVVTMLDKQDDFEDAVTLSAIESEFFTSVTVRDTVRRALPTPSPITTTAASTTTTATTTKATARTTTTAATTTTVASTSQPGSIVYDLKQLKPTTSSKPRHKEKQPSGPDRDRHRRLFKISSILQNRFKSIMKNLTATTKHSTNATLSNVTTLTSKYISKRTCILFLDDTTVSANATTKEADTALEENADENEGFKFSYTLEQNVLDDPDYQESQASDASPPPAKTPASSHHPPKKKETPPHGTVHHHYHHYTAPHPPEARGREEPYYPPPAYHRQHTAPPAPQEEREEELYAPPPTYHHHYTAPTESKGRHEDLYSPPPEYNRQHTTHRGKVKCKKLPVDHEIPDSVIYFEPETYSEQLYYEHEALKLPPTPTIPPDAHCDYKREASLNTYTAKDVAALEVIVDLMKNTLNYEDNNMGGAYQRSNTLLEPYTTRPVHPNGSTNAIQVHIAIPCNFPNGKKRSPSVPNPVRVRKVFCAKMSTPVDLEYQVHSFEGTIRPTSTRMSKSSNFTEDALSPGMYLLIDKPRKGYGLRPILGQINLSDLKSRQVAAGTTASMSEAKPTETREETTSLKSLAKVTLSKDFVAAVNQQLIEMYENMSRVNKDVNNRPVRSVWKSRKLKEKKEGRKRSAEKYIIKRGIDWDAIRHFFGHDRVCNCKCKSNIAMCRACAASDAVIDELIFEFDNIGRYMADHCTEIQTFFWMNPIGGQRLRESVNKIDKSLTDYYKRVKGKCQGRLCKTFTNYIDKRRITKTYKIKKEDSMSRLMDDLAVLAEDLNRTVSLKVCYNDKLKESGDRFIHLMNSCFMKRTFSKRSTPSTTTTTKLVKNVYSLDNINVNIFCNPESSTAEEQMFTAAITGIQDTSQRMTDHLLDFDIEETKEPKYKKRIGLKKLFPRKNKKSKLFSYFDFNKKPKTNYKRQVDNQAATPLISDGGGAFWYDYLKAGTNEPRLVRDSINDSPPNIEIAVVQKTETTKKVVTEAPSSNNLVTNTIYMTLVTNAERNQRDIETTTDTLSQNINQMLQLFGSLQDIESMNNNSNRSVKSSKKVTDKEKQKQEQECKQKKPSLMSKVKQKMAWSRNKTTTSTCDQKARSTLKKELKELKTIEHELEPESKTVTSKKKLQNSTKDKLEDSKSVLVNTTEPMVKASTLTSPTKIISTTTKVRNASENAITNANITNVIRITTMALRKEDQSETTLTVNESTTNLGFMGKLKAATQIFRKGEKSQTPERETETPTTTINGTELIMPLNSGVIDIVTDANNKVMDYVIEETTQNATQNPTIVIINEYGNKVNGDTIGDKEEFKNLLLSIIQFETNNLNNEWERVAYAGDRYKNEDDVKRSIVNQPKVATVNPTVTLMATPKLSTTSLYEDSLPEMDTSTKQPEGILDKIVSKMGIKVVKNKKKVVKKTSIRQVRKDRKNNFIRNRRLRINSNRSDAPSATSNREARDSRRAAKSSKICDIQATYEHLKKLQRSISPKAFEMVVKNVTCYRYKNADPIFVIHYKRKGKRWDWIRNKRSLKLHFYSKDEHSIYDEAYTVNFEDDSNDSFERFAKGDDGIYKIVKRRKRTANLEVLERGLRNIPNLTPGEGELYVMAGDTVTMDCGLHTPVRTCDGKFIWKTDRNRMLKQDNVYVDDVSLVINNVEPKNVGTYTCSLDHTVRKNVKLNVLTIPSFDIVFLPVYKTQDNCSYDDLKAIQRLDSLMANEIRCGRSCSVRIDEPVCQRDKATNSTLVRVAAVISVTPRALNCSLQCKRDIVSSLVMLCATNTAVLSSIRVLVSKDGVNETLTPWRDLVRPVVTHTLRKKDTNGHHEYHKLMSLLSPGKVDVVLICPAGYYLLPKYKLCSSCPPNTSSKTGDNTCRSCPRGTRAEPGAAKCHLVQTRPRRYDWWWYPPCGYVVACCGVLFGCTACVLLSLIVHVLSRDAELKEREGAEHEGQKTPQTMRRVTVAYAHIPGTRPLSPSRVILPRFFKPSPASSRATDSQETKFELWKERNRPPPLPPIDFDP